MQVFTKGFDSFLNNPRFYFVSKPKNQLSGEETNEAKADRLNNIEEQMGGVCKVKQNCIVPENPAHVAFYTFCKLLDAPHLGNFRNELIKFTRTTGEWEHLFEIIELCLLSADTVPANNNPRKEKGQERERKDLMDRLGFTRKFIDPAARIENWGDLFLQSDTVTPVTHAPIELCRKYGTLGLLEKLITDCSQFKITENDFEEWQSYQQKVPVENDGSGVMQSLIAKQIATRETLHRQWVDAKNNDEKERIREQKNKRKFGRGYKPRYSNFAKNFIERHGAEYRQVCTRIDQYNWLDNKLHFVHLNKLHGLVIDILGRMAGFVAVWERDFQFFSGHFGASDPSKANDFSKKIPEKGEMKGEEFYKKLFLADNFREVRNHISHFNYLTTAASLYSLVDLINELRKLMHYDRKFKNAVSKSFIDMFDRHGMILKLKFNNKHVLKIESLTPKTLNHLGKNDITTNQVSMEYCELCRNLLEFRK